MVVGYLRAALIVLPVAVMSYVLINSLQYSPLGDKIRDNIIKHEKRIQKDITDGKKRKR